MIERKRIKSYTKSAMRIVCVGDGTHLLHMRAKMFNTVLYEEKNPHDYNK